jgi:hypothetical protein
MNGAFDAKNDKHKALCEQVNISFLPLIFTSAGSIHPSSRKFILKLSDMRSQRLSLKKSAGRQEVFHRLSLAIHHDNARCILSHGYYSCNSPPSIEVLLTKFAATNPDFEV